MVLPHHRTIATVGTDEPRPYQQDGRGWERGFLRRHTEDAGRGGWYGRRTFADGVCYALCATPSAGYRVDLRNGEIVQGGERQGRRWRAAVGLLLLVHEDRSLRCAASSEEHTSAGKHAEPIWLLHREAADLMGCIDPVLWSTSLSVLEQIISC